MPPLKLEQANFTRACQAHLFFIKTLQYSVAHNDTETS